jgi:carbon starvation protein
MLSLILIIAFAFFFLAYFLYGRFLERRYDVDSSRPTPSHTDYDGIDRVPAHRAVLLGHHFSSIAGAGPIVGPILAASMFGWLPVLLWVVIGSIFIGGVHDFSALIASIRHKARSIAEIAKEYMSPLAYKLLLAFIWLSLIYVLTVFIDLTATTFVADGGVATSSIIFMALAVGFGVFVYRLKIPVLWSTLIFVPLVFVAIWVGQLIPIKPETVPVIIGNAPAKTWDMFLIAYCFVASVTPVWILLQPRDYLSSFLLYASVVGGFFGILVGGILGKFSAEFPAFLAWSTPKGESLFPILFITVACGACSGFHSIVASGTSSKQIDKESDARLVGYGAMLIEGIVAVVALITVAIVATLPSSFDPQQVYAAGMAKFLSIFHIPEKLGKSFGLLAISTFILTTLDTATRLSRYIFEEFFELKGKRWRYLSTAATLVLPSIFVLITLKDASGNPMPAWKVIWPVFGATNQLLAGLVLLVIAVWLKKTGKKAGFVLAPMAFMNVMTIWAIVLLLIQYKITIVGIIAAILLVMALILIIESVRTVSKIVRT